MPDIFVLSRRYVAELDMHLLLFFGALMIFDMVCFVVFFNDALLVAHFCMLKSGDRLLKLIHFFPFERGTLGTRICPNEADPALPSSSFMVEYAKEPGVTQSFILHTESPDLATQWVAQIGQSSEAAFQRHWSREGVALPEDRRRTTGSLAGYH